MFSSLKRVFVFTALFFISGCTFKTCSRKKDIPPEDQLYSYISRAVDITQPDQRQELVHLTTGPLKSALVNASEDSFKRAYIDKHYDFKSFEMLSRKDIDPEKQITIDFKLVYKSWNAGEDPERVPVTETVNRATMLYDHGQWAVSNVENVTTSMDWDVGLPLDGVSTKGVSPNDPPVEIESSREEQ